MRRTLSYAVVICAVALLSQACASSQHRVSFAPGSINTSSERSPAGIIRLRGSGL